MTRSGALRFGPAYGALPRLSQLLAAGAAEVGAGADDEGAVDDGRG